MRLTPVSAARRASLLGLISVLVACGEDTAPPGMTLRADADTPASDAAPSTPPDAAPSTPPDAAPMGGALPGVDAAPMGGAAPGVDAAPMGGAAGADAAPAGGASPGLDAAPTGGAVGPDAAVADAFVPPVVDAGVACMAPVNVGDEDGCGDFRNCVDEACQLDLRPRVFRMSRAQTIEPATAQAQLNLALQLALATGSINLILEPAGYTDLGYRFNLGNGRLIDPNNPALGYVYNHTLPIQDLRGDWRVGQDGAVAFQQLDLGVFTIWAPTTSVVVNGQRETCWTDIRATVRVRVEPELNADGTVTAHAEAQGYMTVADAERIVFPLGANNIALIDYLDEEPVVDADGDGVAAEYNFHIAIDATEITLADNNPERDPNAVPFEPAECDQP